MTTQIWNAWAVDQGGNLLVRQIVDDFPDLPSPLFYGPGVRRAHAWVRPDPHCRTYFARQAAGFDDAPDWLRAAAQKDLAA